jgi:hypothetical protein
MTPDEAIGAFLYGISLLEPAIEIDGLRHDKLDPTDVQAIGAAAVLTYRLAAKSDTPVECALCNLAVTTAALVLAPPGHPNFADIVCEWIAARAEYTELQLAAG